MSKPSVEDLKSVRKYIKERPSQDPLAIFQNIALYSMHQLKSSYKDELKKKNEEIAKLKSLLEEHAKRDFDRELKAKMNDIPQNSTPPKNKFERAAVPVMYLVVRESLGMSPGKTAAQVAHGAVQICAAYYENMFRLDREIPGANKDRSNLSYYEVWAKEPTKIVLKANEEKWSQLINIADEIVVDGGFTEVPANSQTVLAFWPMQKDKAPDIIKSLPLL